VVLATTSKTTRSRKWLGNVPTNDASTDSRHATHPSEDDWCPKGIAHMFG
jgi:hypothetical protein